MSLDYKWPLHAMREAVWDNDNNNYRDADQD